MSKQSVADARARHEQEQHVGDLAVCSDPDCREASREISRERAIAGVQRSLKRDEGHQKKVRG